MTPTELHEKMEDYLDNPLNDSASLTKWANERRKDASALRALYAHIQDIPLESDLLMVTLLGEIESMRCDLLTFAETAENKVKDWADEDEDGYPSYDDGVRFDHRAGIGSL